MQYNHAVGNKVWACLCCKAILLPWQEWLPQHQTLCWPVHCQLRKSLSMNLTVFQSNGSPPSVDRCSRPKLAQRVRRLPQTDGLSSGKLRLGHHSVTINSSGYPSLRMWGKHSLNIAHNSIWALNLRRTTRQVYFLLDFDLNCMMQYDYSTRTSPEFKLDIYLLIFQFYSTLYISAGSNILSCIHSAVTY